MALGKDERLQIVYGLVNDASPALSAAEAKALLESKLVAVEDEHSGEPNNPDPEDAPLIGGQRMYPALARFTYPQPDGGIICLNKRHKTTFGPNGAIRIEDRQTGKVFFAKAGADGKHV